MGINFSQYVKTINPEDLPAEAWTIVLGQRDESAADELYRQVSWLFRAVEIRCNGVMSVPFTIYKGSEEIDNSAEYQNTVGFLPNLSDYFGLIEMAFVVWGAAYLYKRPNILGTTKPVALRYLPPSTIQLKKDQNGYVMDETGKPFFLRSEGGVQKEYDSGSIAYFWKKDPFVEFGPPNATAFSAATAAAGVILDVNLFTSAFLQRGAVKPFILTAKGVKKQAELDKLKDFIARIFARDRKKSWPTEVINAEEIVPVTIGEGLEAIAGKESLLGHSKREEVATALGIPHSILFSGAANYAVSDKDDYHLYDKTIVPECTIIENVMNEQILNPAGYSMRFNPEALDIFQEDEEQRATSINNFVTALDKMDTFEEFEAVVEIFGYEISDNAMNAIKAHFQKKAETRDKFASALGNRKPAADNNQQDPNNQDSDNRPVVDETNKWLNKIRHRWNPRTKSAASVEFKSDIIPAALRGSILGALEFCKTIQDVEAVFASVQEFVDYP